jgi:hypothetical protein
MIAAVAEAVDRSAPSDKRIKKAFSLQVIQYCVAACPIDLLTYEMAVKTTAHAYDTELGAGSELLPHATFVRHQASLLTKIQIGQR